MKLTDYIRIEKPLNSRGLFSKWQAHFGDVTSVQPTQDQAVDDLMKSLREAVTDSHEPAMFWQGSYYALVWREWGGWRYAIREQGKPLYPGGTTLGFADRKEACGAAQAHLIAYAANMASTA